MKRKIKSIVALLAAGLLTPVLAGAAAAAPTTSPVVADTTSVSAPGGGLHLYEHDNLGGTKVGFSHDTANLANSGMDDKASSMENFADRPVVMYDVAGSSAAKCSGRTYYAQPNSSDRNLTDNGFDNRASCVDFI